MTPAQATDMVVVSGFPDDDVEIELKSDSIRVGDMQSNMAIYGSNGDYTVDGELSIAPFSCRSAFTVNDGIDVWICSFNKSKDAYTSGEEPSESFDGYIPVLEYYGPDPQAESEVEPEIEYFTANGLIETIPSIGIMINIPGGYVDAVRTSEYSASLKLNFYRITPSDTAISNVLANSPYSEVSTLLGELEPAETYDLTTLYQNTHMNKF